MLFRRLKAILFRGLCVNEESGLFAILGKLGRRFVWSLLVTAFLTSATYCVFAQDWNSRKCDLFLQSITDASQEIAGIREPPTSQMDPLAQATFWQTKVSELSDKQDLTAEQRMGAALMLDSPSFGYSSDWASQVLIEHGVENFWEERLRLTREFWKSCNDDCDTFAAQSVSLAPHDNELWRIRAALLFSSTIGSGMESVRNPDWLSVIESAKVHDPDNAYYDYLVAAFCWAHSSEAESDNRLPILRETVHDPEMYDLGWRHFYSGLKCSTFRGPATQKRLMLQFARLSGLQHDASRIACDDRIEALEFEVLRGLQNHLRLQVDRGRLEGDVEVAIKTAKQQRRIARQVNPLPGSSTHLVRQIMVWSANQTLELVAAAYPESVAGLRHFDQAKLQKDYYRSRHAEMEVMQRIMSRFGLDEDSKDHGVEPIRSCKTLWYGMVALTLSAACFFGGRRFTQGERAIDFGWRYFVVFGGCFLATALACGLVPAEILSGRDTGYAVMIVGMAIYLAVIVFFTYRWYWRDASGITTPPPVRFIIWVPAVLAFSTIVLAGLASCAEQIPVDNSANLSPVQLAMAAFQPQQIPEWYRVLHYWSQNRGTEISFATGCFVSMFWVVRRRFVQQHNDTQQPSLISCSGHVLLCWFRPALAIGLLLCSVAFMSLSECVTMALSWEDYRVSYCSPEMEKLRERIRTQVVDDSAAMQKVEAATVASVAPAGSRRLYKESFYLTYPEPYSDDGGYEDGF